MAIAAVPRYLGTDFAGASPGMRFGIYLPLWGTDQRSGELLWTTSDVVYERRGERGEERADKRENKVTALRQAARLTEGDKALMRALHQRQAALALPALMAGHLLALDAKAVAPFTTGLGNEHPLENGFAFLNPYGLPYLPGSGVKGVLRAAARELAHGDWGDPHGWTEDAITALFGLQADDGGTTHQRGALSFWDVVPQLPGDALAVDVMTPHQSHYLQGRESPHDSGQPNPIAFLTVPPGTAFAFHVACELPFLNRIAAPLVSGGQWQRLLEAAFAHAFQWLGFGAKTAVGYGAMAPDAAAQQRRGQALAAADKAERDSRLTAAMRLVETFVDTMKRRVELLNAKKEKPNAELHQHAQRLARQALEGSDWSPEEKRAAADAIEHWLPLAVQLPDTKDAFKKLQLRKLRGEN